MNSPPPGRVSGALAYILTLGVAEHFRRRGLASELIRRSVKHVEQQMPHVQVGPWCCQLYEQLTGKQRLANRGHE